MVFDTGRGRANPRCRRDQSSWRILPGMTWLPNGNMRITERLGKLRIPQ
jgi:hypothetical protein